MYIYIGTQNIENFHGVSFSDTNTKQIMLKKKCESQAALGVNQQTDVDLFNLPVGKIFIPSRAVEYLHG